VPGVAGSLESPKLSNPAFQPTMQAKQVVEFSLRFPGVIGALGLLVTGYGALIAEQAKLDVFAEFAPPRVASQT
jgi:hypothetical protein